MIDQVHFDTLERLAEFLDKEVSFRDIGLSLVNGHFYRLQAKVNLTYQGNSYHVQFCGTDHTMNRIRNDISDSERKTVDEFTSTISRGDIVLTEEGSGKKSRSNNFKDTLKSWLEQNPKLVGKIRMDYVFRQREEVDYAADQVYERGADVINMDIWCNPKAIGYMVERLGLQPAISEIKSRLELYIPDSDTLNRFVHTLFTEAGIIMDYQKVETQRCRDALESTLVDNEMRDDFMSQSVLNNLQCERTLYVIAQTRHIKGILQRVSQAARINSLCASVEYTPEKMYEVETIRKLRDHYISLGKEWPRRDLNT